MGLIFGSLTIGALFLPASVNAQGSPPTPARCQNISGLNEQSACILKVQQEIGAKCGALSGPEKDKCTADINNEGDTTPDPPTYTESDCDGDNIRAGIKDPKDPNHCGILNYIALFIRALSGIVGVVVVAMIVIGGIQYSATGGDPGAVASAKKRIVNALLALVIYIFSFALLQYLIPGGVL